MLSITDRRFLSESHCPLSIYHFVPTYQCEMKYREFKIFKKRVESQMEKESRICDSKTFLRLAGMV